MAKKAIKKSSRARRVRSVERASSKKGTLSMDREYKDILRDLASNPAVRYVAAGIATAVLTKIASNLSERYPEVSSFIKENLENVEGRLGDFRDKLSEGVRH